MNSHSIRTQIAKISVLRNLTLSGVALLALTSAAYAQAGTDQMLKDKDAADSKAAKEYINRMQTEQDYQKAIREQPSAATSNDPWGTVRTTTAPANAGAKPAAKSATGAKTASGSSKPAGAIKPATGTAASGNTSAPKGQ